MPRTKPCVGNSSPHANNTSSSTSSSSSPKSAIPREYADPGLRSTTTTTLFRAVNPELFIRPNKYIMAFGLLTISGCVAYIAYLHATEENKMYSASEDHSIARAPAKKSKWD